jgi:hypothetical protein
MAIGRISGQMLKSNLLRSGTDLAFETNLLVLDVTSSFVGIGTASPARQLHISGTGALRLPSGSSAQRGTAANGDIRYNSDNNQIEGYSAGGWKSLVTEGAGSFTTITASGDVTVSGNLEVSGTTTTVNSENLTIEDPLLELSSNNSGGADVDAGLLVNRGSAGNNAAFYWNEGDDKFKAVTTTSNATATSITDSATATIVANIEGALTGNADTVTNGVYTTDTATVTNAMLAGSIANGKLSNSAVTIGSTSLSLGATATTIAGLTSVTSTGFTGALTGNADTVTNGVYTTDTATVTNAMLAGSIANSKLTNDSVSFGGVSLDLGGSDASPAFDLSDATNYPTSSLTGTITNDQLAGSIANGKLSNSAVTIGSTSVSLGATATTIAGLTSVTSTGFTGALTGNADTVTNGVYTTDTATVTNAMLAGSIANAKLTNSSITVSDGSTSTATSLGGTITIQGTANEVSVSESSGTFTIGLPDNVTIGGALIVSGDLTVSGTTTTVNTETINLADNIILLNSNESGTPSQNGGIEINRGTSANKTLVWDESTDKWTVGSETFVAATFEGNITGALTGNADTATALASAVNIAGQSFDGSGSITIASTDLSDTSSIALLTSSQTLTNKTLTSPIISSISNTGILTLPTSTDTLVGKATTDTLTNKTFDANGTGNSISNIEVADFAAGVLDTDLSSVAETDTTIASAKAIKDYVDGELAGLSQNSISQLNTNITVTDTGSDGAITITADGNTELVINDASATFSGAVNSAGAISITQDSTKLKIGSDDDLQLSFNGTNSLIATITGNLIFDGVAGSGIIVNSGQANVDFQVNGQNDLNVIRVDASTDRVGIKTASPAYDLDIGASSDAVKLPQGNTAARPTAATGIIRFNTETGQYEGSQDGSTFVNFQIAGDTPTISKDTATGDGSTATFTSFFGSAPANANNVLVFIDNVYQEPTENYTVSSTNITFTSAPHASARIFAITGFDNTAAATGGIARTQTSSVSFESSATTIMSFSQSIYRSAELLVTVTDTANAEYSTMKALVVHNGTTAFITTYGITNTGASDVVTLTAVHDGSNTIEVKAQTTGGSQTAKVQYSLQGV